MPMKDSRWYELEACAKLFRDNFSHQGLVSMSYCIEHDPQAKLIELQVFGLSSMQEALEARLELALLAREHNIRRVLISARRLEGIEHATPEFFYNYAAGFREKGFPSNTRFAVVRMRISETVQMCCDVARKTGTHMQAFTDIRLALEWLFERITTAELQLQG
jgi:hypothetical protein